MSIFLNQDGSAQPLQPNEQFSVNKSEKSSSAEEVNESDDEVFPHSAGEEFASREEVVAAIEKAFKNDKDLLPKLVKYAQRKMYQILGKTKNVHPDDIVAEAFSRIISLKRRWYKKKVEKIENLILMVIVSLIRIEAQKVSEEDNQLYNPLEDGAKNQDKLKDKQKRKIIPLYYKDRENPNNDNTVVDIERFKYNGVRDIEDQFDFEKMDEENYIELLEEEMEGDELAYFVLQARLDGNRSNIEIARDLGVDVKEIENASKRLKRKITGLPEFKHKLNP